MSVAYKLNRERNTSPIDCGVLDVDFLNRNTFGDKTLRNEIIGLFLSQLDGVHRTLASPINSSAWQFLTHTLKGAAAAVGAISISTSADKWGKSPVPMSAEQRREIQLQMGQLISDFKVATKQL